jgi:hypothetical protein
METVPESRRKWRRPIATLGYCGHLLLDPAMPGPDVFEGRMQKEGDGIAGIVKHPCRIGLSVHDRCLRPIANGWHRPHLDRPPRIWGSAVVFTEGFLHAC